MTAKRLDHAGLVRLGTLIPRRLHAAVRRAALGDGTELQRWITDALKEYLAAVTAGGADDAGRR